jgi:lipopolysaccharide export system permease protein
MKKTLFFYLIKEQLVPLSICFFGLCLILVTGRLLQLANYLFTSSVTLFDLLSLMALAMPSLILYTLPMAALMGTLLAFVRLNSDNELIALRAAGIAFQQLLPGIASILLAATFFSLLNSVYLMPSANRAFEVKLRALGRSLLPALLKEGTFIDVIPNLVLFFNSVDSTTLQIKGIFVEDRRQPDIRLAIVADRGQISSPRDSTQLLFKVADGVITRVADDLKNAQAISFRDYDLTLNMDAILGESTAFKKGRKEMSMSELLEIIRHPTEKRDLSFDLEFHRRLAVPLSCLLLGLVGPPLGALFRQSGRMAGVTMGLAIFLGYYIVLSGGKGLGENGLIPPFLAIWLPNLLTVVVVWCLWRKLTMETPLEFHRIAAMGIAFRQFLLRRSKLHKPGRTLS